MTLQLLHFYCALRNRAVVLLEGEILLRQLRIVVCCWSVRYCREAHSIDKVGRLCLPNLIGNRDNFTLDDLLLLILSILNNPLLELLLLIIILQKIIIIIKVLLLSHEVSLLLPLIILHHDLLLLLIIASIVILPLKILILLLHELLLWMVIHIILLALAIGVLGSVEIHELLVHQLHIAHHVLGRGETSGLEVEVAAVALELQGCHVHRLEVLEVQALHLHVLETLHVLVQVHRLLLPLGPLLLRVFNDCWA